MADIQSTRAPHSVGSDVAVVNVAFGVVISVIVVNVRGCGVVPVPATVVVFKVSTVVNVTFGVASVVMIVVLKSGVVFVPSVVPSVVANVVARVLLIVIVVFIATVVVTIPSSCSIQLTTRLTS